ncbi:MAG: pyridoxamine 5'-phosphate oxidase family protein [Pseudomonadota bacterium]
MLDEFARQVIARFPAGFTATVDANGAPMVSPKGTFLVLDDTRIGFAHIRSPGTLANLAHEPRVEVNFLDPFLRKGVRVAGVSEVHVRGSAGFDALVGIWAETWPSLAERIQALVVIEVTKYQVFTTPPYDDGALEDEMVALYRAKYAEIYP